MLTCHSWLRTSSITQVGLTNSTTQALEQIQNHLVWPGKSFLGTSRYSCWRGRSPLHLRLEIPLYSSLPRPLPLPHYSSPRFANKQTFLRASSTSSLVLARPDVHSSIIQTSTRWRSLVPLKWVATLHKQLPARIRKLLSNSVGKPPISSLMMQLLIKRLKASSTASSLTKDMSAAPVLVCSCRNPLQKQFSVCSTSA
ncbi:unannotated protein [freshwater metagenome]|uniref:Unannotated protein n=1 Tax=freshwater metagenome TaxID=449393 RepID=A0A6J7GN28_9ZZZZ